MLLLLTALFLRSSGVLTQEVSIEKYPFVVAIYSTAQYPHYDLLCGGSIINHRTVLTSGRCIDPMPIREIGIKAGLDDLHNFETAEWYSVEAKYFHPKYKSTIKTWDWSYDIGLLVTNPEFSLGPKIQRIPLSMEPLPVSMEVEHIGWGELFPCSAINYSPKLLVNKLITRDADFCAIQNDIVFGAKNVTKTMQCTSNENKDCAVSVGSPVTVCGVLAGILAWGTQCFGKNVSMFIINVSGYNRWIYESTKNFLL